MLVDIERGTRLDVAEFGDPNREPLLMVCGTTQSHLSWEPLARALANEYRVFTYDHRGIGASERGDGGISMGGLAGDAAALLGALRIERAHCLGWSLGSAVCQELALAHPDRVATLVLWGTWDATDAFQRAVFTALRHPWLTGDVETAAATSAIAFSPELINSPEFEQLVESMLPFFPHTEVQVRTTVEQWDADLAHDTRDRLNRITAPTLVIAGEQDLLTPHWQCEAVARAIPGAQLELMGGPGSSHALGFERPEEFVGAVFAFLGRHHT